MSDERKPVAPGRMLDALRLIDALVRDHQTGLGEYGELDAEQVLERVEGAVASVRALMMGGVMLVWKGSVRRLIAELAEHLTVAELQELAGETALTWREKRRAEEQEEHTEAVAQAWRGEEEP